MLPVIRAVLNPVKVGLVVHDVGVGDGGGSGLHGPGLLLLLVLIKGLPERGPRVDARALHPTEPGLLDSVSNLWTKPSFTLLGSQD